MPVGVDPVILSAAKSLARTPMDVGFFRVAQGLWTFVWRVKRTTACGGWCFSRVLTTVAVEG
jgi:hypothetical protein